MAALPRVGDTFGRYRIDSEIGRGGMGVVLGATDTTIGRTVALKVVSPHLGGSSEFQQRFEREASVLARLDSPHVIAIYDYGTHDDCPYIATQYVAGGDLGGLVATRGPMPPRLALQVCAQVADALADAHRVGVVHRDVKPANVLLRDADSPTLHAYLCDFGIARTGTDGLTQAGAVAGTWSYLSPESGRGAPATPSSDLYALGCLLWALLSGAPPYRGSDVEVAVAHQRAPLPQVPGDDELSARLNAILQRTLAKEPHQRYPAAEELRADLTAAASAAGAGPGAGMTPLALPTAPTSPARPAAPGPSSTAGSSGTAGSAGTAGGSSAATLPPLSYGSLAPRSGPPTGDPRVARPGSPAPGRRRTALVVGSAVAAVLVVAGGVLVATGLGGDESEQAASTGTTTASPAPSAGGDDAGSAAPERLDEGGPVTGDLDGDGLGDLRVSFSHTVLERQPGTRGPIDQDDPDNLLSVEDVVTWSSDGSEFVEGETERVEDPDGQRLVGDFDGDGDDEAATVSVRSADKAYTISLSADLSGGGSLDTQVETRPVTAFLAVSDLDGDDVDDLVLQYYTDYEEPSSFEGSVLDDGQLQPPRTLLAKGPTPAVGKFEVGDFDGDGLGDLAVIEDAGDAREIGSYRHTMTVWLGTDDGTRRGPSTTFVSGYRPELLAADVDGDEVAEIVVLSDNALAVADLDGDTLARPRPAGSLTGSKPLMTYAISDVNGDGLDDVVVIQMLNDSKARLQSALSTDGRFVTTGWGAWDVDFITSKYYYRVVADTRSFE